jgi:hypothetical protein
MASEGSDSTRENIKVLVSVVQAAGIIFSVLWATYTYKQQSEYQRDAVQRELRKPYDERQLNLYLDAARVLAHLATTPEFESEKTRARFWELYWGELAFVESPRIASWMSAFCRKHFEPSKCSTPRPMNPDDAATPQAAAIGMSHDASQEIRDRWKTK